MKLTTHHHPVPILKMVEVYLHSLKHLYGMIINYHKDKFTFTSIISFYNTCDYKLASCTNFLYEAYPQNKFHLQILPMQRCGHYGVHTCRVCWSFRKARTQFADNQTTFKHHPVCLKCSRKSRSPPHVKCTL
jgi:hypothetical protein